MVLEVRNMALLSRRTVLSLVCRSPFHIPASRVPARKWCTVALARPVSLAPAEVAVGADNSASGSNTAALLEKFRSRQIKDAARAAGRIPVVKEKPVAEPPAPLPETFGELGLTDELLVALDHLKIEKPTEVQRIGIPAVLAGENVVVASHTGSGKTLAYMLPIVQALRTEEALHGFATRPKRPRAVVLCPTRELAEQVYKVAKSICHHARFRAAIIGGGSRMKPQEDTLNSPVDMVVGTPGRLLMHIEEGNMVYGDIKYVILDEADTMFDQGFAPEVRKFLRPLRNRASKPGGKGFQIVLVTATITKAVQKLLDEEFPGIKRLYTSTLHKKVATARHEFIKISGSENKLDSLLQVLEPSVSKGNRVMVFCNTVSSCRAVDHHLRESGMTTVNYHGEVPAEERVENLNKFRAENQTRVPPLICTDLAARGLDLVVDQVIMFDFPLNSIDYLHRTGRTARMGAKGKVTSLFTKHSQTLAEQIQLAMSKGESLEGVIGSREKLEVIKKLEARTKKEKEGRKGDRAGTRRGTKVGLVRSPSGALKVARGSSAKSVERKVGSRSSDPKRSGTDTKRPFRPLSKSRPSQAVGSFKSKPGPSGGRGRKPAAVKKR